MTLRQIEIGNRLLEYLGITGQDNTDNYYHHLTGVCGFNSLEDIGQIGMVKEHLKRFGLIESIGNGEYFWALTKEGTKASKVGLSNWLTRDENTTTNSYNPPDKFTAEEIKSINLKLDDLLQKIERLEVGERLIYDDITEEIDELKKLSHVIGKKTWTQTLKGKMIDWGLGKLSDQGFNLLTSSFNIDKLLNG
jgi:hypothetical protein